MNISVILPTKDLSNSVKKVLIALEEQTLKPSEVIIVDSSIDSSVKNLLVHFNKKLNIYYLHETQILYPGEARNKGMEAAKNNIIAFIDSKTIPKKSWLEEGYHMLKNGEYEVIFGNTLYEADTNLQKIFQASIYGKIPVTTTPGSILTKATAEKIGPFIEGVRASEDQDWKNRIYQRKISHIKPSNHNLTYHSISKTLYSELKRNFIYQLHTAKTEAQTNSKIFIFGVFITFLTLLAPSWNLLVGWKISALYIPNITKIYLGAITIIFGILLTFYQKRIKKILLRFILIAIGIASFYVVYRWNGQIAKSIDFFIYFPHITKIYILSIFSFGFVYRGLISPLKKGTNLGLLLPFRWLKIGFICILIDLIKVPGYIIGALIALYRMAIKAVKF